MRVFFVCIVVFFLGAPAWAAQGDLIVIDDTPWGSSFKEVAKKLHVEKPSDSDQIIIKTRVDGHDAGLIYAFHNKKLVGINLEIGEGQDADGAALLFGQLEEKFVASYGNADKDKAACRGEVGCIFSRWSRDKETDIILQRDHIEGREKVSVIYIPRTERSTMAFD